MIIRCLLLCLTLLSVTSLAHAAPRQLTLFSDASLIEVEITAKRGVAEFSFPAPVKEATLRVRPLDSSYSIGRVDLLPFKTSDKLQKELDSLTEQKHRLEDRLKALDTREGIFAAAAKSQSSKAPRKTKTNPDPMTSVRQGTDFAIAQLEAVFTARRRAEQDLKRVEGRLAGLQKTAVGGPTVRVSVTPATSRIRVAALLKDGGWTPRYDIRIQGNGTALLALAADTSTLPDGYTISVTPAAVSAGQPTQTYPFSTAGSAHLANWQLPTEKEQVTASPIPGFSITIKNNSALPLAAGKATIYYSGEYLGTTYFSGLAAGASTTVTGPK
ncbi:MAG: hypothetical protein OEL57_07175 [Trichlorobacter sp.]|uniref:hypothetical protein n=1 Tax=Trichlorobacter sp. TaxID=2911007 RepID=UPI00256DE556|nr:hypothetical protein [Trichlorobacter sp.]MDK9717676.1 hypothetical protein [Trichlorobacter sp.]